VARAHCKPLSSEILGKPLAGKLHIVATPIGNLKDITLRALEVLKKCDLLCCEDTRHSMKLLQAYEIRKPLLSLHEHNEMQRIALILKHLKDDKNLALISDAGTPLISDPGFRLVQAVLEDKYEVESIPGPCAAITALAMSGLATDRFFFAGFLPAKSAARLRFFKEWLSFPHTLIFYESPHRIQKFLSEAFQVLGPRRLFMAREMTKKFAENYHGSLQSKVTDYGLRSWKGEFVLVLAGAP